MRLTNYEDPFFVGLLLSRFSKRPKVNNGFWWCSFFIVVLLVMPRIGGKSHMLWNGIYESVCILLLFPMIVLLGAGSNVSNPHSVRICKFLGEISYPLYITHYPLIYLQTAFAANHPDASTGQIVFLSVGIFFLSIGIAYASMKLYDLPVREWLKEHWLKKPPIIPSGSNHRK